MHSSFAALAESLEPSFLRLIATPAVKYATLPKPPFMPTSGIYLFTENERPLYVGRSRDIRKRLARHCRPGASHRMAAFAFHLAREATGNLKATYKTKGSRHDLVQIPEFKAAFNAAKARIREMDIRFVDEGDPLRQTLLEVYVAVVLQTPYNDFGTH